MARVLVAEDEESVRDFITRTLTMHGHSVLTASDGAEAVDILSRHHVDLVISDIVMPLMDGISLALKAKAEHPETPVILMTGFANQEQRAHNLSALIQGLLTKPFTMEQLLRTVDQVLDRSHAQFMPKSGHSALTPSKIQ